MQIAIKPKLARLLLAAVEVVTVVALIGWAGKLYVADVLANKVTAHNIERAIKLDPTDADYHVRLGRLYEYSPLDLQLGKAEEHFRRATHLDPYDPQAWLELAVAMEFQGKLEEAGACLARVDSLAPNIPAYHWPIANFYLLQGNVDEAFRHLRIVLAGTGQYNYHVFGLAWKATDDGEKILQQLIPEAIPTELSYLDFLLIQHRLDEAKPVWKRIVAGQGQFPPERCSLYIDSLVGARRPEEAYQVWTDLQKKGLIRFSSSSSEKNLISNGDFEDELLNFGFAWRIIPAEGVYAGTDTSTYHSPSHSFLIQFSGKQNVFYQSFYQFVKVSPEHSYHLRAFLKTEGITTDSGPRLEVYDAYNTAVLDELSDNLTGSTDGWTPVLMDFVTGPKTELIVVRLVRFPSKKLDNLIAGKVWLDDVQLTPVLK